MHFYQACDIAHRCDVLVTGGMAYCRIVVAAERPFNQRLCLKDDVFDFNAAVVEHCILIIRIQDVIFVGFADFSLEFCAVLVRSQFLYRELFAESSSGEYAEYVGFVPLHPILVTECRAGVLGGYAQLRNRLSNLRICRFFVLRAGCHAEYDGNRCYSKNDVFHGSQC